MALVLNGSPQAPHGGGESDGSMLRHERMSVAMALAEQLHHSAQRPELARARRGARVEVYGRVPEDAPPPRLRDGHRGG